MSVDHLDASTSETVRRHAATFRRVREARLAAVAKLSDDPAAGPALPVVAAREARSDEVPKSAAKLADEARANGWAVRVVYSRSALGVDVVSVRCRRSDDACAGVWRDGRFSDAVVGVPSWPRTANAGELAAYLRCRPRGWFVREDLHMLGPAKPKKAKVSDQSPGVDPSDEIP